MSQKEQKDKVLTNGFFAKSHPAQTGWWYTYPSEKYEFVSWDDEIPKWMESHKTHVPNHLNQQKNVRKEIRSLGLWASIWGHESWGQDVCL